MFIVYKSNQINLLLLKISEIIQKKPLSNIFEKEIFLHENKALFQYINIFFAKKIGISANFKLYHPNHFIWKLFQKILNKKIQNIFNQTTISWRIMNILNEENIAQYIKKNENKTKKIKFSFLMAKIFRQYLIYRPHWIHNWEKERMVSKIDKCDLWQIKLWNKIIKNNKKSNYHFANLFYKFQYLHKTNKIKKHIFPDRFFFISSFQLNPSYIKIFKIISKYIDVYFLYITPFKENIFNFKKNYNIFAKKRVDSTKESNNSIVSNWGKYETYYRINLMNSKKIKIISLFKKNNKVDLLNNIKKNLFKHDPSEIRKSKRKNLSLKDNSISINICYNKKNEIQILYEKLLMFFNEYKDLDPQDIVVTSHFIEDYAPYINMIFKSIDKKKQIPFFICTKFSKETKLIISFFKKILNLPNSRFGNQEILELLDIPEVSKNFNFSEEEISILYYWVKKANIRWGIDSFHKKNLSFSENEQNTWIYGIKKLLLSYAINDEKKIWNNTLSCCLINGSRSELIGKLNFFINMLEKWKKKLSQPKYIIYWNSIAEDLINDFFYINERIKKSIYIIEKNWIEMINEIVLSDYKNKISIDIIKKNFIWKLNNISQKFLPGVINFCYPSEVCFIPFKIICIIGANNQNNYVNNHLDMFDLLKKNTSTGDIDIYQKNSYLFLQSLSCAKNHFYISYIGHSMKYESKLYPNILIDQLLSYISLNFFIVSDYTLKIENNKKKITKILCKTYGTEYFYKKNRLNHSNLEHPKEILKNINIKTHLYKKNKSIFKKIYLKNLIYFWKNPIRYFFNNYLKIKFDENESILENNEPFLINKLESYKIKKKILDKQVKKENTEELLKYYILSGKLPYGHFGNTIFNKIYKEMEFIAKSVLDSRNVKKEKIVTLNIKTFQIYGVLSEIQNEGLLRWKPTKINYRDCISLWIEHLIYSLSEGIGESKIIGYQRQKYSFSAINPDIARDYLIQYIKGYLEGSEKLILLTQSGISWMNHNHTLTNNNICDKSYKKLLQTWNGNDYIKGEKEDIYIKKTITRLNNNIIEIMCKTAKKWFSPILNNKNVKKKKNI